MARAHGLGAHSGRLPSAADASIGDEGWTLAEWSSPCGGLEAEATAEWPGHGETWGEDRAEKRRPPGVSSGRWWAQCPGCRGFLVCPCRWVLGSGWGTRGPGWWVRSGPEASGALPGQRGGPPLPLRMGLLSHLCLRCLGSQSPPPHGAPALPTSAPAHVLPGLPGPGLVLPLPSCRLFLSLVACLLVRGSPPLWLPLQQEPVAASGPGTGAGSGKWAESRALTSCGERVTWQWGGSVAFHFSSRASTDLSQRLASFLGFLWG